MSWSVFCAIILLCYSVAFTYGEFYSSVHKMSIILDLEVKMLETMQTFIRRNENKLNFLKERLSEYERERDDALTMGPVYFENPVNKYLLTKRLTTDWERIENILQYKEAEQNLKLIEKRLVNYSELDGAIDGLLRIQDVYRLNTSDIVRGIFQGVQYDSHFEARHCYDIGKRAVETNLAKLGYFWFKEGLTRYYTTDIDEKLKFELAMADAKFKLGDIPGANQTYADLVSLHPENDKVAKLYSDFVKAAEGAPTYTVDYSTEHYPIPDNIHSANQFDLFKYTCAGLLTKSPTAQRPLSCGYLVETHPFLWLAPIKAEELNHDPLLVVFHDVISDTEIETIRQLTNKIERAKVLGSNGSIVSSVRTSQYQFIPATAHPVLAKIDRRVEDMTNLNPLYYEDHQFANYGIGGHYSQHHDWFDHSAVKSHLISTPNMGNRIGTVLFYLSDVEQGGGTAFPFMDTLLLPKKGSAAFWYNLHGSGVPDQRTLHGACPIIVGSKWVQNRWIREHDQSDRRPCYPFDDTL